MSRFDAKLNAVLRFPFLAVALWSAPRELRWRASEVGHRPAPLLLHRSAGFQPALPCRTPKAQRRFRLPSLFWRFATSKTQTAQPLRGASMFNRTESNQQIRMRPHGPSESSGILRAVLLVVVVVSICACASHRASSAVSSSEGRVEPAGVANNSFERFLPKTEAERELEKILHGTDAGIDLALANWLVAADVPEFQKMTREAYFDRLDTMTEQVRREMTRMQKIATSRGQDINQARTRCAIFCNAVIQLRFAYAEEFRQENLTSAQMKALYANPDHIFLAGLLRTRRGSCLSMPLIYLVIGQRLGMPVHLVAIGKHYFIRWDEPGYRMNIETTIVDRVSVTADDAVYLEAEGLRRENLAGSDLRNLTRREVLGHILFARSAHWATKGPEHRTQQLLDLSRARSLAPEDSAIAASHRAIFSGIKTERTEMRPKP
jgi:regulator of sirC expression with transglutaminase-like and TPR domain